MRLYETTFILSPQADDAAFDRQVKAVTELVNRFNGKVVVEDRWGIRRLAYAIQKYTQGYYTRLVFEGNETLLGELDRFYRLEEAYIRNLTVCFEGKLEESEKLKERAATVVRKPEPKAEVKPEPKAEVKPEPKAEVKPEPTAPVEAEKPAVPETTTPSTPESSDTVAPESQPADELTPSPDDTPEKRIDDTDNQL